jgi:glutamate-1-semialdehyde 2,1-aminomutase
MFTLFFCPGPVTNFAQACQADTKLYARFFHALLARGIYLPPSQFEAAFVNLAIQKKHLKRLRIAARAAFAKLS